jgi:signal transduction histidine kinase
MTLLREDRDFAQDRRREYYKLMLMQSQRLERLIEDLLEVTRLEAGAGLVDATAIDAVDLVRQGDLARDDHAEEGGGLQGGGEEDHGQHGPAVQAQDPIDQLRQFLTHSHRLR